MSKVIVESIEGASFGEAKLLCPNCGGANLHHRSVEIYTRKEDQTPYQKVLVEPDDTIVVGKAASGNPSNRRDGIVVHLDCENCGPVAPLLIAQHKGETHLSWGVILSQEGS